jgi:hypothetical protein
MKNNRIISMLWKEVMAIDECRRIFIEKQQEFVNTQKKIWGENEAKKAFREQIGEYIKEIDILGKKIGDEENKNNLN